MSDPMESSSVKPTSKASNTNNQLSNMESELYLLIVKFLNTGVCKGASEILKKEMEEHQLLPKRYDWHGEKHIRSFGEMEHILRQVSDDHLLKICQRIGPILDKEIPPTVPGLQSLFGVGRQSLLRTKDDKNKAKVSHHYLIARKNGAPFLPCLPIQASYPPNIVKVLISREYSGPLSCRHIFPSKTYARLQPLRRFLGHLSSVYCVLFDRTGKYIFTGADDHLVKIWSATDGRLMASLRGHSAEITDMAVNYENTLLAAGSCDKTIRVWCVRTTAPIAILTGHTAMVTSIQFCPYSKGKDNYLVSTGNDGCVCFWRWDTRENYFNPKPLKFTERNRAGAQMICSSFSQGGVLLATGSTDHNVRVYNIAASVGPEKILEKEIHTDRVDSIQFSNLDCRFVSGSKDGTAQIWRYERQNWHCVSLKMATKLPGQPDEADDSKLKLRVTMVGWTLDDGMIITAVSDHSVKVWDSVKGVLCHILKGHEDEVFVLESHPLDSRILLSSGHDGRINLWDLNTGTVIKSHFNLIEGQGHGAVFDCKFAPDGQMFASTDSHGHLSIFGLGSTDRFKKVPEEQFFHTDYRPLLRDPIHNVVDEQTQMPPHLLPPPFLVDIDGNPYPPNLQRLVPGREHCNDSQLIPYISVSAEGDAGILEPVRPADDNDRPTIDDMIERLQQETERLQRSTLLRNPDNGHNVNDRVLSSRSGQRSPRVSNNERSVSDAYSPRSSQRNPTGHSRVGMRRTGDIEGVRQSVGNWQSRENQIEAPSLLTKVIVKPMSPSLSASYLKHRLVIAEQEIAFYNTEKRKRCLTIGGETVSRKMDERSARKYARQHALSQQQHQRPNRNTRNTAALFNEFVTDLPNHRTFSSSSETETEQKNIFGDSSGAEESFGSGDDSDWLAETNDRTDKVSLRHPKPSTSVAGGATLRSRKFVSSDGDDDNTEEEDREDDLSESDSVSTKGKAKPKKRKLVRKEKHEKLVRKETRKTKKTPSKKLPERYRPPEWLTDVMPHKVPYVPQIGDEVVYFKQGHELYVQAVRRNRLYEIFMRNQPWRQLNLRDQEVVRVIHISFENHVPRLCCLKLELLNPVDEDEKVFTLKYHDMPAVVDFLVLKQYYDQGMQHDWKAGDRFRAAIDKAWWLGTIKAQKPYNENYPDSPFLCFLVKWDNGEKECMSPWDLEPYDPERMPDEVGGSVDIVPEERQAMMYCPSRHEWSSFGQDYDIDRIVRGLNKISELSIAESFTSPVDLVDYPSYAMLVAYPMDLGTIKARLQNRFYRRLDAAKFDLECIKQNAIKFNEPGSRIVKQAKCLVELCLKFFDSVGCEDPMDFYNEMLETKRSRSQDSQSELDVLCSESDLDTEYTMSTHLKRKKRRESMMQSNKRRKLESQKYTSESWKIQCSALLDEIFQLDDSTPFRKPVSLIEYPDYRNIIDCPMDLSTVKEKIETNQYFNPIEFCKDMRLIYRNSRNYNINKKSKIYSMTIRLSASFEEQIRSIVSDWKSVVKYEEKLQNNQFVSNRRKPFSIVGTDVTLPGRSSRQNDGGCRSDDLSQPGPSRRNHTAHAKYEDPSRSRSRKLKLEGQSSKIRSLPEKNSHLRHKLNNSMTNGVLKNPKLKSVKIKVEKDKKRNSAIKKSVKQEPVENNRHSEDSDKTVSESEPSSPSEEDDDDDEYKANNACTKRRKIIPTTNVQHKLRPRSQNVHHSNRTTRSTSQRQQNLSVITKHFHHSSQLPNLRSRSSPPNSLLMPQRRPNIHRLVSNAQSPRSSRLSTLRHRRMSTQQNIRSSAGSDSNESDQTSKSKENSDSANPSKSMSDSSDDNDASGSQHSNSNDCSGSEHSNSKEEHSESDCESQTETSPDTDQRMRRSTRATTRDSTKATVSALNDSKHKLKKGVSQSIQTRNRGQRTVRYIEDSDDSYNYQNSDDENDDNSRSIAASTTSISSRGRLRKLIKHGKTLFSE